MFCRQDADVIEISTPAGTNFTLREDDSSNRRGIIVNIEYLQSVCSFVGIGSLNPLPRKLVCLTHWTQRGKSLAGGWPRSDDWIEILYLHVCPCKARMQTFTI